MPRFIQMNPRDTFYRRDLSLSLCFVTFFLLPGTEEGAFLYFALAEIGGDPSSAGRGTTKRERSEEKRAIYIFPWMARTRARVSTRVSSMPRREETAGVGPYTHKRRNAILIIGSDYLCRVARQHRSPTSTLNPPTPLIFSDESSSL